MTYKYKKKKRIFMFLSAGCSFLRQGFSCSLCVLYGGLRITKLQFFSKKYFQFFFSCKFPIFGHHLYVRLQKMSVLSWSKNKKMTNQGMAKPWIWNWIRIRIISMRIHNPDPTRSKVSDPRHRARGKHEERSKDDEQSSNAE
jgi:hypothetical protein